MIMTAEQGRRLIEVVSNVGITEDLDRMEDEIMNLKKDEEDNSSEKMIMKT